MKTDSLDAHDMVWRRHDGHDSALECRKQRNSGIGEVDGTPRYYRPGYWCKKSWIVWNAPRSKFYWENTASDDFYEQRLPNHF